MPVYRVKKGQQVNHNSELLHEGDTLEIPRHVAYELRNVVEATDEEGALPEGPPNQAVQSAMQSGMRAHEKLEVLKLQKEQLEKQLKGIDAAISAAEGEVKAEIEARQRRAAEVRRPQEPVPAPTRGKQPEPPAQEA